jgi:hypothetical protein
MSAQQQRWYFCVKHQTVEPEDGCPAKDRLGPYNSPDEAAHALDKVHERNEQWDSADGDDN